MRSLHTVLIRNQLKCVGSVWSPNNLVHLYPLVADNSRHFYHLAKTDLLTELYDRRQTYFLVLLPRPLLTYLSIRFWRVLTTVTTTYLYLVGVGERSTYEKKTFDIRKAVIYRRIVYQSQPLALDSVSRR